MNKKYNVIYADPPWRYEVYSKKGLGRSAESHYPTMHLEDICSLPVVELAEKDCALFLWVTIPCLLEGLHVLNDYGMIDGIINNGDRRKEQEADKKPSILEKLQEKKEEAARLHEEAAKQPRKRDHDIDLS